MEHKTKKQYLVLRLSGGLFAAEMCGIKNIILNISIKKPEREVDYIIGCINVDDICIPLIDLKAKMGMNGAPCEDPCVIVAESYGTLISFAVDSIQEVLNIDDSEIQPSGESRFLKGAARCGYKLLKILDINKLCSESRLEPLLKVG